MSLPEKTELRLRELRQTLGAKGLIEKYEDVNEFLVLLDQSVAENLEEIIHNNCQQFLDDLRKSPPKGCCESDIDAMKNAVQNFLFPRMELSGKCNMSNTVGPSGAGQKSPKINVAVGSLSKTAYNPAGKASQQSSGDTQATLVDKREDLKHKSTISVSRDRSPSAGGQQTQSPDSVMLDQRTKKLEETIKERDNLEKKNAELFKDIEKLNSELKQKQDIVDKFEQQVNDVYAEKFNLKQEIEVLGEKLNDQEKTFKVESEKTQKMISHYEDQLREMDRKRKEIEKRLTAERDDLRNRYSKLAGQALKENNADISDLSDPYRPMKLGEKFSELYDNEWTDVYSAQTDTLKRSEKDSIKVLLSALEECYTFCKQLADKQMDMLKNAFLYHCQDAAKTIPSGKDKPRLHSKDEKSLLEVRKMIGAKNSGPVKQAFVAHMAGKPDKPDGKVAKEFNAYYEKCTEICWLMALNDPPLYMDMEVKTGTKIDINLYTSYYTHGDKADFLVWPPLFNVHKGGLINKGVIAPVKEKKIIKK